MFISLLSAPCRRLYFVLIYLFIKSSCFQFDGLLQLGHNWFPFSPTGTYHCQVFSRFWFRHYAYSRNTFQGGVTLSFTTAASVPSLIFQPFGTYLCDYTSVIFALGNWHNSPLFSNFFPVIWQQKFMFHVLLRILFLIFSAYFIQML